MLIIIFKNSASRHANEGDVLKNMHRFFISPLTFTFKMSRMLNLVISLFFLPYTPFKSYLFYLMAVDAF